MNQAAANHTISIQIDQLSDWSIKDPRNFANPATSGIISSLPPSHRKSFQEAVNNGPMHFPARARRHRPRHVRTGRFGRPGEKKMPNVVGPIEYVSRETLSADRETRDFFHSAETHYSGCMRDASFFVACFGEHLWILKWKSLTSRCINWLRFE